jgi:hypothetical protein
MFFQAFDEKEECHAVYSNSKLHDDVTDLELTRTWAYTEHVQRSGIIYAHIWALGKNLQEACPEDLKEEYEALHSKGVAFIKAFATCKINLNDVCFYDLVPRSYLMELCEMKNKISKHVFENIEKPENYDFLVDLTKMLTKMSHQNLNLTTKNINLGSISGRNLKSKIESGCKNIFYDQWKSTTGRLTTKQNSFPILTMDKRHRHVIEPKNDWFVEVDYNAAELRTLLALNGVSQPEGDIHEWLGETVFKGKKTRDEVKKKVFAWLYNPKASNKKLEAVFKRTGALEEYYYDGCVHTPFGRKIKTTDHKALNYLIQSTASDLFLTQLMKIDKILDNRDSFISFCVHDSAVIDFSDADRDVIKNVVETFSNTQFGDFKCNLNAGKNYGSLRRLSWKQ